MLSKDQLDLLREILFLDADAAASHAAALLRVEHPSVRLRLESFRKTTSTTSTPSTPSSCARARPSS